MAEKEVGFLIKAKDDAKKVIRGIGVTAKTAAKTLRTMGTVGKGAFDAMGKGAEMLRKGMEIARGLIDVFNRTIGDSVRKALEFRKANDPVLKWFKDAQRETDLLRARIGDALIPVIQGLSDGLLDTSSGLRTWIEDNRKLIGTKLLEWIHKVGTVMIKVLLRGINWVSKAINGWRFIINGVQLVFAKFFEFALKGLSGLLGPIADAAKLLGAEGLGKDLESAIEGMRDFADAARQSGDDAIQGMTDAAEAVVFMDEKLQELEKTALRALQKGVAAGLDAVEKSTRGLITTQDERDKKEERLRKRRELMLKLNEKINSTIEQMSADNFERVVHVTNAAVEAAEELTKNYQEIAVLIGNTIGVAFGEMLTGQKTLMAGFREIGSQMKELIIQSVEQVVIAEAVKAAARAASGAFAIPIIGPALAAGLAATAFGLVKGILTLLPFQEGGEVVGGVRGRDSVPALLTPGERVLTVDENRQLKNLLRSLAVEREQPMERSLVPMRFGGTVPAMQPAFAMAGPKIIVNQSFVSVVPPTSAEAKRAFRETGKAIERARARRPFSG